SSSPSQAAGRDRSLSPSASDSQPDLSLSLSTHANGLDERKHNGTLFGMIRRTSQNVGTQLATSLNTYLPSTISEMWEPARDFAWCKIPKAPPSTAAGAGSGGGGSGGAPLRSVVAMSANRPQVMVVTSEGHFYVFNIDLEHGGEGSLYKVYEVGGESERLGASMIED
ncbi:MAG: hypothetical protein Q9187_008444, partial [Circinaria calcarea]